MKRRGVLWVGAQAVLFVVYALALRAPTPLLGEMSMSALSWGGLLLAGGGGLWSVWAMVALRRSLSPFPEPTKSNELVSSGPYQWVRHPIYTGLCLCLGGWALFRTSASALLVDGILLVFFLAKARYEERQLLAMHPGYSEYMKQTPWRVFPWL